MPILNPDNEIKPLTVAPLVRSEWMGFIHSDYMRKSAGTYLARVASSIAGLLSTVMVARYLGPQGRGDFSTALAISSIGMQLAQMGWVVSNTWLSARDHSQLRPLLANSWVMSLSVGGIFSALVLFVSHMFPVWVPIQGALLWVTLAWVPIGTLYMLAQSLLLGVQKIAVYNWIELGNKFLALVLMAVALIELRMGTASAFFAALVALIVGTMAMHAVILQKVDGWPLPSWPLFRTNLAHGMKSYALLFFNLLIMRADLLLVRSMMGAKDAGWYGVATGIAEYAVLLPTVMATILLPKLTAMQSISERIQWTKRACWFCALVTAPTFLVGGILTPWLLPLIFGREFLPSVIPFLILLPGMFFFGMEINAAQFLQSIGLPGEMIGVWAGCTAINIAANYWIIPIYGIQGSAAVCSVTYALWFLAVVLLVNKKARDLERSGV